MAALAHSFALEVLLAPLCGVPEDARLCTYTAGRLHQRNDRMLEFFKGAHGTWEEFWGAWKAFVLVSYLPRSLQFPSCVRKRRVFAHFLWEFKRVVDSPYVEFFWREETGFGIRAKAHIFQEQSREVFSSIIGHHVRLSRAEEKALENRQKDFSVVLTRWPNERECKVVLTGPLSLLNHACSEYGHLNAVPYYENTKKKTIKNDWKCLEATRDIAPGHEILVDYGDSYNIECTVCTNGPLPKKPRQLPFSARKRTLSQASSEESS
jgi:hypothetical protein